MKRWVMGVVNVVVRVVEVVSVVKIRDEVSGKNVHWSVSMEL